MSVLFKLPKSPLPYCLSAVNRKRPVDVLLDLAYNPFHWEIQEVGMIFQPWIKKLVMASLLAFLTGLAHASEDIIGPRPPDNLRCEYLENPIGIDVKEPRFSWVLKHSQRGQTQSAYQLIVSSDPLAEQADIWDSDKVASDQSLHVVYDGKPLESDRTYFWKVRYWDDQGVPSPYSHVARFLNREGYRISRQDGARVLDSERDIQSFFEQILREGIETGEFHISNPALVACNILIHAQTWVLRQPFLRSCFTVTLEQYTEEQVRVLLEAISTGNSRDDKILAQVSSRSGLKA